jgi:glutamyl-tRNA reductase
MYKGFRAYTFTHKHCNIRDISRYVIQDHDQDAIAMKLAAMKEHFMLDEVLYLATCNRVLYLFHQDESQPTPDISDWVTFINPNLSPEEMTEASIKAEYYEGSDVIEHIFEVSASLDSLVVGEREIFRQLREAYDFCTSRGLCGDNVRLLMKFTVQAAKDVYSNTGIGERALSVVALAIQKMQKTMPDTAARILLVGAGQTNHLVSKFLIKYGFTNVQVFNRSIEKADRIASKFSTSGRGLDELLHYEDGFDILFVCTGSHDHIINEPVLKLLRNGEQDLKLIIDLAMPSNVAPEVQHDPNVQYIDIEELRQLAATNLDYRRSEVHKARQIIDKHLTLFRHAFHQRLIERAMKNVPSEIKAIRQKAIGEVFAKDMAALDENTRKLVENMLHYMEKKCISIPIKAAKSAIVQ